MSVVVPTDWEPSQSADCSRFLSSSDTSSISVATTNPLERLLEHTEANTVSTDRYRLHMEGALSSAPVFSTHGWPDTQLEPVLVAVIVLAATGTTILFAAGVVAYSRRKSLRYLLITLALGALAVRSFFGLGTVFGVVPMTVHHLVEHSLDFLIAVLVLYAVYRSGPSGPTTLESDER